MLLSRDQLLAARAPRVQRVDLPELGEDAHVFLRPLTGKQRGEIERRFAGGDLEKDPGGFRAELLVRTICDSTGALLLTVADIAALLEQPATVVEKLFEASAELSALRKKDIEGIEKN